MTWKNNKIMSVRVLFSEGESYYRNLGLKDSSEYAFEFDGLKHYKKNKQFFKKYDAVVMAYYTLPHNALLTIKAKEAGVKTVLIADGVFEFGNSFLNPMVYKYRMQLFHPLVQDYFICVGELTKKYFARYSQTIQYIPERMMTSDKYIPLPRDKKVLITTANTAYFNHEEFGKLKDLLVFSVLELKSKGVLFSFRIYDEMLLKAVNDELGFSTYNDINNDFETTLENYSTIITTPSSICVTAMYHKRSVATLIYRDYPISVQSGWIMFDKISIRQSLSSLIDMDDTRMEIQKNLVSMYIPSNNLNSALDLAVKNDTTIYSENNYYDKSMMNMLTSAFNFNFEYLIRNFYLKLKKHGFVKKLAKMIK